MVEQALSMMQAKDRLLHIQVHMPTGGTNFEPFCRFLAHYLNPELVPQGFVTSYIYALEDLKQGIHRFTREPLHVPNLVGQSAKVYTLLYECLPMVAAAIFSDARDFQEKVVLNAHERTKEARKRLGIVKL